MFMKCEQSNFYSSGRGDRLIDPNFFPVEISHFLKREKSILSSYGPSFDLLVEVGCMQGRYLGWAVKHKKRYIGIDIVNRYIEDGRKALFKLGLASQSYQFILGGAEHVDKIDLKQYRVEKNRSILFFPFNSFGNIPNPLPVIKKLKETNLPFLISTYQTISEATSWRKQYYQNCGYKKITIINDEQGICFTSSDGLRSIAYHPEFLLNLFYANGISAQATNFCELGVMYNYI